MTALGILWRVRKGAFLELATVALDGTVFVFECRGVGAARTSPWPAARQRTTKNKFFLSNNIFVFRFLTSGFIIRSSLLWVGENTVGLADKLEHFFSNRVFIVCSKFFSFFWIGRI